MCPCLHSSGIELMNAAALLLLFLLNLLLVGRQERLKRSEMVWRLKGIITQLSGESDLLTWRNYSILFFWYKKISYLLHFESVTLHHFFRHPQWHACWCVICPNPHSGPSLGGGDPLCWRNTFIYCQTAVHNQYTVGPYIVVYSSWNTAQVRGCWTEFEFAHIHV